MPAGFSQRAKDNRGGSPYTWINIVTLRRRQRVLYHRHRTSIWLSLPCMSGIHLTIIHVTNSQWFDRLLADFAACLFKFFKGSRSMEDKSGTGFICHRCGVHFACIVPVLLCRRCEVRCWAHLEWQRFVVGLLRLSFARSCAVIRAFRNSSEHVLLDAIRFAQNRQ